MTIDPRLRRIVAAQPHPLLFAAISGAHLYGFGFPSSPRVSCPRLERALRASWSDYDLRGACVPPRGGCRAGSSTWPTAPQPYGSLILSERDVLGGEYLAL